MEAKSEKLARELRSNNEHYELLIEERDKQHEAEKKALSEELETERESRQKLLSSQYDLQEKIDSLQSTDHSQEPKNKTQEYAQNENIRLAAENLALQESCHRYRHQIQMLVIKLEEAGGSMEDVEDILGGNGSDSSLNTPFPLERARVTPKKQREYRGMFEYKIQDEPIIMQKLIPDLKPHIAVTLLPLLPAYILFMMLRHADHVDDEPKMHSLTKGIRTAVKNTLKRRADSVEYSTLWLANMLRLLNNLRQYSGDAVYQASNTPRQNQQSLRIFDLSEFRQDLSDMAIWIYQRLIKLLEGQLQSLVVPDILEYEEICELSGPKNPVAGAGTGPGTPSAGPGRLKQVLAVTHDHLKIHHVDASLRIVIFKQLFYYICTYSLNHLLLRKELCCWAKGLQIRNNISHLETWIKEHLAEYGQKSVEETLAVLRPITQAVQLLQARKSMADVTRTVEMCADLSAKQVCQILKMYTPAEEYEVKVTKDFIHEIQKLMQERAPNASKQNLLIDCNKIFGVQFNFNGSSIHLEDIEVPNVLELDGLLTKI